MIAIITPDGTISVHPIEYSAWLTLAGVLDMPPGTVVIGPGIDGTITITPRSVDGLDETADPDELVDAATRAAWAAEQIAALPNPAPAKAPRKSRAPKVTVPDCFDGEPLRAYLRANGPQTIGQLVTSMGGTSEAMRAALDAIGAAKSGKTKGTRYSAPALTDEA